MKILIIFLSVFLVLMTTSCDDELDYNEEYTGITETAPDSPTLIGNVDPDDWLIPTQSLITFPAAWPAFPNPTNRFTTFRFGIPQSDSVVIWLDDRPQKKVTKLISELKSAGIYKFRLIYYTEIVC